MEMGGHDCGRRWRSFPPQRMMSWILPKKKNNWLPKSYYELQWVLSSLDSCYRVTPQRNAFSNPLENAKPHEVTIAESMAEVRGKDDPEHVLPKLRKLE